MCSFGNTTGSLPYKVSRVYREEAEKRDTEDLCPGEPANAVQHVVARQVSLSKEEVLREAAKVCGFARMRNKVGEAKRLPPASFNRTKLDGRLLHCTRFFVLPGSPILA
jgi:hypothetical protein